MFPFLKALFPRLKDLPPIEAALMEKRIQREMRESTENPNQKWTPEHVETRAKRKQHIMLRSAKQAKLAKLKLILSNKGRNGCSMNDALLKSHGLNREGKAA